MRNNELRTLKKAIVETKNTCGAKFEKSIWNNSDNAVMYKKMPLKYFKQEAIQGGLNNGCDIKAIIKYIKNAGFILEVGAGYGRVLNYIIKNGFASKLFALERELKLCRFLKKQFPQIPIIHTDIRRFKAKRKFDLILWMWASLCDFSQIEQLPILKNLVSHLNVNGFLIFDLIPTNCKIINAIDHDQYNKTMPTPYGKNYGYFPSTNEVELYIQKLEIIKIKTVTYTTKTNKKRNLYVLQKI